MRGLGTLGVLTGLKPGHYVATDHGTTHKIFWALWALREHITHGTSQVEFFLNTVDEVEASAEEVVIKGVCSPVLRSSQTYGDGDAP
jgi:hypothetical protein